jgi:hypothetical protein
VKASRGEASKRERHARHHHALVGRNDRRTTIRTEIEITLAERRARCVADVLMLNELIEALIRRHDQQRLADAVEHRSRLLLWLARILQPGRGAVSYRRSETLATSINKALVMLILSIFWIINLGFGWEWPEAEQIVGSIIAIVAPFLVWLVP